MNKIKLLNQKIEARWPGLEIRLMVWVGAIAAVDICAIAVYLILKHYRT